MAVVEDAASVLDQFVQDGMYNCLRPVRDVSISDTDLA